LVGRPLSRHLTAKDEAKCDYKEQNAAGDTQVVHGYFKKRKNCGAGEGEAEKKSQASEYCLGEHPFPFGNGKLPRQRKKQWQQAQRIKHYQKRCG